MSETPRRTRLRRWNALPALVSDASPRVLMIVGVATCAFALLIVARPLTSLLVLGIYVGLSAIVSGVLDLRTTSPAGTRWNRAIGVASVVFGIAVLVWPERSLDLLPLILSVMLIINGLASIGQAVTRGLPSERVLSATWGASQIVLGILAATWIDLTVLVAATLFGVWLLIFGISSFVRGLRALLVGERSRLADTAARRRRRAWAAAGRYALALGLIGLTITGWWVDDWLGRGAPVVDAFYTPPADVPAEHGRLIRVAPYDGAAPPNGEVQRILYTTRDAVGRPAVASALVIVPTVSKPGARPVVAWNHGTTGVARGCAPSLRTDAATKWAIPALEDALDRGWVVVATDYAGQGAPGVFPYLIGKGEARSTLDGVLAAQEVDGLALAPYVALWGHSQGGHAALWAAQEAADYSPELEIRGAAALAPVTDPLALARELRSGEADALLSVLISWVLVPYADTYPDVRVVDYAAPRSRTIVREMSQRCPSEPGVIVSVISALGVSQDRPLYPADLTRGALGVRLAENAVTGSFDVPLLVTWGTADEVIPPEFPQRFVDQVCERSGRVRWVVMEGERHLEIIQPPSRFLSTLLTWTEARFTNSGAPDSDCARFRAP